LLQQGPNSANSTIVAYGAEGLLRPANKFYMVNNTVVNDRQGGTFVFVNGGTSESKVINNVFAGSGSVLSGPGQLESNVVSPQASAILMNPAGYDYRLKPGSIAIDAGRNPGTANGFELTPKHEYVHTAQKQDRTVTGALDAGAYEFK
ncbi:MAG TPA: hypothetical protein VLA73_01825, partial [Burkholderiales bacterium]|nr:hypothetical protein [Burkholderiales bacterium]